MSSELLKAVEMVPGFIYETAQTEKYKYRCRVHKRHDALAEVVKLSFWDGEYNKSWLPCEVPFDYRVRKLRIDVHQNESRTMEMDTRKRSGKAGGLVSGLGMMACWGLYFRTYIGSKDGRALIVAAMSAEFPDKVDSIKKWVDSYKSYYNMGKLPGCVKQEKKLKWVTTDPLAALEDCDE